MAIIYTYPTKTTPNDNDLILISDSEDGNKTKNATVTSIKDAINVVDSITATSPLVASASTGAITLSMPAATSGVNGYLTSTNWSTFNGKQEELQSGINIKTINSNPILGSGDLVISGAAANPAGDAGQIQYNNDGTSFGALPFFTTNRADKVEVAYELGLKGDGTNHGLLKLYCEAANAAHHVGIKGPNHTGGSPATYTIQLPNSIATTAAHSSGGRILESNASGELKWITTPTGGSGGPGTGTQDAVPLWATTSTLGDSLITQNSIGTVLNIGTDIASFSTVAGQGSAIKTQLAINGYTTYGGKLKLFSPDGNGYTIIEGPANGGTGYELKMPNSVGTANQVLKLPSTIPGSGASQLVWGDATGGVTYTFSTGLSESGGTVTLDAGLNNLTNVSFATGANGSLYVGQISSAPATGLSNVTLGGGAGKVMSSGTDNTLIGSDSASLLTVASHNVIVGSDSAAAITEGGDNVLIGSDVAATLTTGTDNVVIGKGADVSAGSVRSVIIGEGASGNNDSVVVGQGSSAASTSIVLGKDVNITGNNKLAIGAIALNTTGYETQTYYLPIQIKNTSTGYMDQYYIKLWT